MLLNIAEFFKEKFIVHDVPANGNCLFSALAFGLGSAHTSESVRRDIVTYLNEHMEEVFKIVIFCVDKR
jgi:hypothetical protein